MKLNYKRTHSGICILLILLLSPFSGFSQEEENEEEAEEFHRHKLSLTMGHSHISSGIVEEGKKYRILASFAAAYFYNFNEKWSVGMDVDMILENFEAKSNLSSSDKIIIREKPVAPAVMVAFKPKRHSSFMAGMGAEFSNEETLLVTRFIYEWGTEINENWEFAIPLSYDLRWEAFDVWMLGFSISRRF